MRSRTKSEALLFWLCVFVVSLLVMVQPAQASGSVALTVTTVSSTLDNWIDGQGYPNATPQAACTYHGSYPASTVGAVYAPAGFQGHACVPSGQIYHNYTCPSGTRVSTGEFTAQCQTSSSCPVNSTGTTTFTCNSGFQPDASATSCVSSVVCPVNGTIFTSGFYDIGTIPSGATGSGAPPLVTCSGSCERQYTGASVSARSLVNGVYHYYAKGSYVSTGANCTGSDNTPGAVTVAPLDACAAGQSSITMGGVTKCLNSSTGQIVDSNSASAVAAAKTLADAAAAASIAAAASAVAAAGGSASDVAAAKTVAAGVAGAATAAAKADPQAAFCQSNSDAAICKPAPTVAANTGSALPTVGTGSWYVKTYPQGVSGVLTTNFNTMKATPLFGLINQLVPTLSGAAHTGCFSIEIWHVGASSLCIPPMVMQALGIFMLLTALFAARAIIFGG